MATQILDAFVVQFSIDADQHMRRVQEVRRANQQLREETTQTFTEVERKSNNLGQSLRSVRNDMLGLVLAFAGARSLTDFAMNMLHGEAAAGRLSQTLGMATNRLMAWQIATKQMGGQPGEADSALQSMATAIQSYKLTGTSGHDADLLGLGVTQRDLMNGSPEALLLKIANASQRMSKPEFAARLQRIGLPQSTIYLLEQGRQKLAQQLEQAEKLAHVTEEDARAAAELDSRLVQLQATIQGLIRPWLTDLVSGFIDFVGWMQQSKMVIPIVTGMLGALAIATVAATWPWLLLATAIAGATTAFLAWQRLQKMTPEERKELEFRARELSGQAREKMLKGDLRGYASTIGQGFSELFDMVSGKPLSTTQSARGAYIQNYMVRSGFTAEQAKGITAGIYAESGFNPNASNPVSGATGLGQWLGPRKAEMLRRYGPSPTLEQQLAYLVWELHGGDRGGPSVGRQVTADHALLSYVSDFMRPAPGAEMLGDISRGRRYLDHGPKAGTVTIGEINVHTQATDAQGIAKDIGNALKQRGVVVQADAGVAP